MSDKAINMSVFEIPYTRGSTVICCYCDSSPVGNPRPPLTVVRARLHMSRNAQNQHRPWAAFTSNSFSIHSLAHSSLVCHFKLSDGCISRTSHAPTLPPPYPFSNTTARYNNVDDSPGLCMAAGAKQNPIEAPLSSAAHPPTTFDTFSTHWKISTNADSFVVIVIGVIVVRCRVRLTVLIYYLHICQCNSAVGVASLPLCSKMNALSTLMDAQRFDKKEEEKN